MNYEFSGAISPQELEVQIEKTQDLLSGINDFESDRKNRVMSVINQTVLETRTLLELPENMEIYLHADQFSTESEYGTKTAAEARMENERGHIFFNPETLRRSSDWDLRALTAHEMYHLREYVRYPKRSRVWQNGLNLEDISELRNSGHYALRGELAADLFALGYLKHKMPKNFLDKADKTFSMWQLQMTSRFRLNQIRQAMGRIK